MNLSTILYKHGDVTNFQKINEEMGLSRMHSEVSLNQKHVIYHRRTLRAMLKSTQISPLKNSLVLLDPEYLDKPERDYVYEKSAQAALVVETPELAYTMIDETVACVKYKGTGLVMLVSVQK